MKSNKILGNHKTNFNLLNEVVAKIENKIVIKVENEIITNFEIKNKIISSLILTGEEINQENINKYKKQIINTLIDNKLKKIEVTRFKIKKLRNFYIKLFPRYKL